MRNFIPQVGRELRYKRHQVESPSARLARLERETFYNSRRWRSLSRQIIAATPICQHCHEQLSAVVDHIVPRLDRPDLSYEPSNLRALCSECHSAVGNKSPRGVG